ncbi:hypothetical protein [Catenuloplanes indicus]|uniref:Uncharacterized protein n=1 Tax=Catenuloplanes indicus TaxID=137267 RepID=A0AAE4AWZ9_9ACTN|nr:hypothetical protein [Catenuloplanes indicus]MDQ0365236.1 hypothetical protein [Catenuloplanes indicus]
MTAANGGRRTRARPGWRSLGWWNSLAGIFTAVATLAAVASAVVATLAWLVPRPAGDGSAATSGQGTRAGALGTLPRTPVLGLEFHQAGAARALTEQRELVPGAPAHRNDVPVIRVGLARQPFEMLFPRQYSRPGLHICAWRDSSIFSVHDGADREDVPFFRSGTGMAEYEFGSGTLELGNDRHNYKAGNRIARHSETLDKIDVAYLPHDGDVYLTVFIDMNQNYVIDYNEYEFLLLAME